MSLPVRLIQPEEIGTWAQSVAVPFLDPANTEDRRTRWEEYWSAVAEIGRTWAVEDRGRFVGNACVFTRTVTLPGTGMAADPGTGTAAAPGAGRCPAVPMAAVTAVGVHPTHRRRRLLRGLMGAMLADARQRGEPVAGLFASEAPIYGRFGFGPATQEAHYRLATRESAFARPAPAVDLELVQPSEAATVLPGIFRQACARRAGQVDRTDAVWSQILADRAAERGGASALSYVVCPGGFASWRAEEVSDGHDRWARVRLRDLMAGTAEIEAALWRFVLDLDLVREVQAFSCSVDDPIRYRLRDPRQLHTMAVDDGLWLRILDTPAALTARGYSHSGRLVLDVRAPPATPTGPDGLDGPDPTTGRWVLDAGPGGAACRPATAAERTDLVLGLAELSALLAGGVRARTLAGAGLVDEERAGALERADVLFAGWPAPLSVTHF